MLFRELLLTSPAWPSPYSVDMERNSFNIVGTDRPQGTAIRDSQTTHKYCPAPRILFLAPPRNFFPLPRPEAKKKRLPRASLIYVSMNDAEDGLETAECKY